MNAAAGTTSSNARSNGARGAKTLTTSLRLLLRIDEHALGRYVNEHVRAEAYTARRPHVQPRATRRHDIDERIATAVFDVVDTSGDDVLGRGLRRDRDLLGPDRDRRALPVERQPQDAGELDVRRLERHAPVALAGYRQLDDVAIAH